MEIKAKNAPHVMWLLFKSNTTVVKVLPNGLYFIPVIYEKAHVKGIGVGRIAISVKIS